MRHLYTICKQGFIASDGYKHSIPRTFIRKAIECNLLPKPDLEEMEFLQAYKTFKFLSDLDAQGAKLTDYEFNLLQLRGRDFMNSNRTRDYNEEV